MFVISVLFTSSTWPYAVAVSTQELLLGFEATPNPSVSSFQSLLNDSAGNFSLGFLRVNQIQLALSVIHLPSLQPLWQANPTLVQWSDRTQMLFNGSLVIFDLHSGVLWSTETLGDKIVLLNTSNLQILKLEKENSPSIIWQSFDYPKNTLVENQNLTSNMSLVSSNGLYSLRLGSNFMALYAKFKENQVQMYWKHVALEVRADIIQGKGSILARVESNGYLGMFQTGKAPVDIQAFSSYNRPIYGFLFVRLEMDGNLKGYFWDGSNLVLDYQAISQTCELPSPCGSYGLCMSGSGCSCLDNQTEYRSGGCFNGRSDELCSAEGTKSQSDFSVLRRKGVDLPFKEYMSYKTVSSVEQCESLCGSNCSCWGAVYNNATGFCYLVDYPIHTLWSVSDKSKLGYFKVSEVKGKKKEKSIGISAGILGGAMVILIGVVGFGFYRIWRKRRGVKQILEEEDISPGPYKDLGSASFKSIEMGTR